MTDNINHIIEKYWAGESTLEEESQLQSYLASDTVASEHLELVPLFEHFADSKKVSAQQSFDIRTVLNSTYEGIDSTLEKYWAGNTSLGDEEKLKAYFSSDQVRSEHQEFVPLFSYFREQEALSTTKELDMTFLGETKTIDISRNKKSETKVRRMFPRLATIAASVMLMFAATFAFFNSVDSNDQDLVSAQETEEALQTTMEALAFLGHNYDKGAEPMKHLKQLEKTNIFKFN